jgi:outer membrane protein
MNTMKVLLPVLIAAALGTIAAPAAHADTNDNWVVRFGVHAVDPKNNNGTLAKSRRPRNSRRRLA